ncbi:hypothetical protein LCGC14_1861500, partial [marine sediment metagenome]
ISETGVVLVGGKGGILSINENTLEINELNFGDIGGELVRGILQTGNAIVL